MSTKEKVEQAKRLIATGSSQRSAAAEVGLPESTLRYHLNGQQYQPEQVGVEIAGDSATLIGPVGKITDPQRLMREMGVSPDEWEIANDIIVNRWGGTVDPSYQLKLRLRRRNALAFVTPAVHVPPVKREQPSRDPDAPKLVAVVADQQAPYYCPEAHALFCGWLEEHGPDEVVLAGDTMDFPTISRHKDNPEWHVPVQECINSAYQLIRDYAESAPAAKFTKLLGNHDERIRNELLLRAERLYGITPAPTGDDPDPHPALSIKRLLHLDALGVELVEPEGNYTHAQYWIAPELAVRHGWLTGANTADKSLRNVDYSMIVFHTHRQTIVQRTIHTSDGTRQQFGVVGGAMCRIDGGMGFAVDPNWQNGFVTAWIWPDGQFQIDLANIHNGVLTWNGERRSL